MQKRTFYDALSDLLIEKGIQQDNIDNCISQYAENHDLSDLPDDFSKIDIHILADDIASEYKSRLKEDDFEQEIYFPDFDSETTAFEFDAADLDRNEKPINPKRSDIKRVDVTKSAKYSSEKVKGSPLYWCLFVLLLPITVPLFIALCVFIGLIYIAVTALIVSFVLLMVAVIAAGTALSLVGIIYGIIQIGKSTPVGLCEIGIGIALGGLTMLLSILLYNFAIRLLPKLYKAASVFTKKIFHGIGVFNTACKKECLK